MAVFRVGSGRAWHLRRSYSHDNGRSWSSPDILPAYSVYPQLVRAANGVIALSTGRPGVDLWLSADPRGADWQKIDIAAFNNQCAPDATFRIYFFGSGDCREEIPDRLLHQADRDRPQSAPVDLRPRPGDSPARSAARRTLGSDPRIAPSDRNRTGLSGRVLPCFPVRIGGYLRLSRPRAPAGFREDGATHRADRADYRLRLIE